MQQRNRIAITALLSALAIGAAYTGYVLAQVFSTSGHSHAGRYDRPANAGGGSTTSPPPSTSGASSRTPSASIVLGPGNPRQRWHSVQRSLAQFIARQAGTALAGAAPQYVPRSQVKELSGQLPAGASIDTLDDTITFHSTAVSFTVVAIAPGKPDMTFTIAGLANPAIVVPRAAQVTVWFINNDTDEAHGWLITDTKPPFGFGLLDAPAITSTSAGPIGNPTSAGDGADIISFTASDPGSYDYICPMPGHAQMGMHGSFVVR